MADQLEQYIVLGDGRKLGYGEYGDPQGTPVFLFHGIPGSRMIQHPDATIAQKCQVRLIVPERPGMGLSDFKAGRKLLDWPADVEECANALGINNFAVAGFSGGGAYAAACGYALSQRLLSVGLISSVSPINAPGVLTGMLPSNRMGYSVGRGLPWCLWRLIFKLYYHDIAQNPEKLAVMNEAEPASDQQIFEAPRVRQIFRETFSEAFRQGTRGAARDGWLLSRPWGFALEAISIPVFLWQGEADVVVTPAMGRYLATRIPNCSPKFYPSEGHFVFIKHWSEILKTLISVN